MACLPENVVKNAHSRAINGRIEVTMITVHGKY